MRLDRHPACLRSLIAVFALAGLFTSGVWLLRWFASDLPATELDPGARERSAQVALQAGELAPPGSKTAPNASDRRRVVVDYAARALAAAPRPPQREIELHVLDAHTRAPLGGVAVRLLTLAALRATEDLSAADGLWTVGPSPDVAPGPHVPELPVIARGATPLRCAVQSAAMMWITADGYGWANVYLENNWPDRITVLLEATVTLDVIVSARGEYTHAMVDLDLYANGAERGALRIRRRVEDGVARFTGLAAGRYEALAIATHAKRPDGDQVARGEGTLAVGQAGSLRLVAESLYGELAVELSVPLDVDAAQRIDSIDILQRSPLVLGGPAQVESVNEFVDRIEFDRRVFRFENPMRVAAGPFELIVKPHGTRVSGIALSEELVTVELDLPELVQRRVTVTDVRTGAPFRGLLQVEFESAPIAHHLSSTWGRVSLETPSPGPQLMLLPDVPFYFYYYTATPIEWLTPELLRWPNGRSTPIELHLELRSGPERDIEQFSRRYGGLPTGSGEIGR